MTKATNLLKLSVRDGGLRCTWLQISCHKHSLKLVYADYIYHQNRKEQTMKKISPYCKDDITIIWCGEKIDFDRKQKLGFDLKPSIFCNWRPRPLIVTIHFNNYFQGYFRNLEFWDVAKISDVGPEPHIIILTIVLKLSNANHNNSGPQIFLIRYKNIVGLFACVM